MPKVAVEDFVAIQQLVGEYQWRVDEGDEGWIDFWLEDGVFDGGGDQVFRGHDALLAVPRWVKAGWDGGLRHLTGSFFVRHGETNDVAIARYYNFVSTWDGAEPRMFTMALSTMRLERRGADWKIARVEARQLVPPRDPGATD